MVTDEVWKLPAIVDRFLSYRAALPLAQEQIGVMMAIIKTRNQPVEKFLDLGCGDGILGATILGEYPNSRGVFVDSLNRCLHRRASNSRIMLINLRLRISIMAILIG